jgi:hypothetical protein
MHHIKEAFFIYYFKEKASRSNFVNVYIWALVNRFYYILDFSFQQTPRQGNRHVANFESLC